MTGSTGTYCGVGELILIGLSVLSRCLRAFRVRSRRFCGWVRGGVGRFTLVCLALYLAWDVLYSSKNSVLTGVKQPGTRGPTSGEVAVELGNRRRRLLLRCAGGRGVAVARMIGVTILRGLVTSRGWYELFSF